MQNGDEVTWQAEWIWGCDSQMDVAADAETNRDAPRYFYFRKTFTLAADVETAVLRACADTRYRLWLNGRLMGHGPARSDPAHQYYDIYDTEGHLRPGENTIAVLVTHYGIGTCFSRRGRPGLLLQLEITQVGGANLTVGTANDWKCAPAPYLIGFPRMSIQLAYPEVFDARQEPVSWNLPGFNHSEWQNATVIGPVGTPPWTTLIPRDIPLPYYRAVADMKTIQVNVVDREEQEEGEKRRREEDEFIDDPLIDGSLASISESQLSTPAQNMERATRLQPALPGSITYKHPALFTVVPQSGTKGVSVVLDFGKEVSGFPLVVVRKSGGGRVDIGYSERIETDGTINPNRWGGCDVHYADRLLLRNGHQTWEALDHRAFRYMRLDFYDNPESVEMLVEMRLSGYPVEKKGNFQCSDAILQRIWEVGCYTTELCMDDGFMDCPWRERGQWLGDARVEALVAAYAFGDTLLVRKALLQYPQSQEETGWFRGVFPADPPFNSILPTFCMIWPVALWDYFLLTNDRSLLETVWPNVEKLIAALERHTDDDGLVSNLPGWVFVDWASVNTKGQSTAVNAMAVDALQHAAKIARALGYPDKGSKWQIAAHDIREAVNDLLWDRERGVYIDGIINGEPCRAISEQANILCALVGIADAQQTERVMLGLYGNPRGQDSPRVKTEARIATPYFAFYQLLLLYRMERHDFGSMVVLRGSWARMLGKGATTFWEQWGPHWSLCHAWSAAPSYFLMAYMAGIRPTQPGFEEFDVHLEPLKLTWLRCAVPTPHGNIELSYHNRQPRPVTDPMGNKIPSGLEIPAITVNLTVPTGTRAHVRLPLGDIPAPTILLNGKKIWDKGNPVAPSGDKFIRKDDYVVFAIIGGRYQIEIGC